MNSLCFTLLAAFWLGQSPMEGQRLDRQGDPLPPNALVRLGSLRFRGDATTVSRAIAISPNGKMLATTEIGPVVRVWEAATGKLLHELRGHTRSIADIAFSPDGKILASAGFDKSVRLWNIEKEEAQLQLDQVTEQITSVVFSPDGTLIAGGCQDATIRVWGAHTGKEKRQIKGHGSSVTSIVFSMDGKMLASGSTDNTVGMWETATGKEIRRLEGHLSGVHAVAFSPDGKRLFSASLLAESLGISSYASSSGPKPFLDKDSSLRIWDVASGKALLTLSGPKNGSHSLICAPDGKTVAAVGGDNTVHLFDTATGQELWQVGGKNPWVRGAVFTDAGKTLITAGDTAIQTWDAATGKEIPREVGHFRCVCAAAFSPDGNIVATGSWDHTIRLWDAANGVELFVLRGHKGGILSVAFSPDGALLASASEDRTLRLWDTKTGKENSILKGHEDFAQTVGFSADGKTLVSGGVDRSTRVWDIANGQQISSHPLVTQTRISRFAVAPDGKQLAYVNLEGKPAAESVVRVVDAATGKETWRLPAEKFGVNCLVFSRSGQILATGSNDGSVCLWDLTTGAQRRMLMGQKGDAVVSALAFSDDDRVLAAGGMDRIVRVYELATGRERLRFEGAPSCYSLAFDPASKRLVSGHFNSTALIWDVGAPQPGNINLALARRKALWEDMKDEDAKKAFQALKELAGDKESVTFIRDQVKLVNTEDMARIDGWIIDLNSDNFATRQKATTELRRLGAAAGSKLAIVLKDQPGLEMAGRVKNLLAVLKQQTLEMEAVRTLRAVEMLERVASAEARQMLDAVAQRCVWLQPSEQARAALRRMGGKMP
jgi:WD40 repeat protein